MPSFLYNNGVRKLDETFFKQFRSRTKEMVSNLNVLAYDKLIDMCVSDPPKAEEIINKISINDAEKIRLFQKYTKEARRLLIDIKHERESKMLGIKHR